MKFKTTQAFFITVLAVIGVVVLILVRNVSGEAVYPLEHARRAFALQVWDRMVGACHASAVAVENRRLRREVAALALLQGEVERLEIENARLRRALSYVAKHPEIWLAAGVLSHGGGAVSVRRTIRVDKGLLDGVREGAAVAVPEGLVGRITEVSPHTSEIVLLTDPSVKIACEIEGDEVEPVRGILCGGDESELLLRYIRRSPDGLSQARVVTSGLGGVFPRGLEIGTLMSVSEDKTLRTWEGFVRPSIDYETLEDVFIRREK